MSSSKTNTYLLLYSRQYIYIANVTNFNQLKNAVNKIHVFFSMLINKKVFEFESRNTRCNSEMKKIFENNYLFRSKL